MMDDIPNRLVLRLMDKQASKTRRRVIVPCVSSMRLVVRLAQRLVIVIAVSGGLFLNIRSGEVCLTACAKVIDAILK